MTYINVKLAIAINIHHRNASLPRTLATSYTSLGGNILKLHLSFVQIELVFIHITGKIQIIIAISIDITHSNTSTIIEVLVHEYVSVETFVYYILEIDMSFFSWQ
jgi:hypothetical protein